MDSGLGSGRWFVSSVCDVGVSELHLSNRNPSLEDQACDRIYRVGQEKDVVIHR